MSPDNPTRGFERVRADRGGSELPLPPGVLLASYDSALRVRRIASGSARVPWQLEGMPLAEAVGVADPGPLLSAARAALEGRSSTITCALADSSEGIVLTLAPHPEQPGTGLMLLFDAPRDPVGADRDRDRAEELELVFTAARELARSTHSDEVRTTLCEAARTVSTADAVALFEPDQAGEALVATASLGFDAAGIELPLRESSGAAMAMRTNVPKFLVDARSDSPGAAEFPRRAGLASVLWQPVARGRTVRAVLGLGWARRIAGMQERTARLLEFVAVEGAVAIDRGSAFERMLAMARSDPLTGLGNRRAWSEELGRELARARRERTPLAVALIDLDGFKQYNDSRGHPAGDRLLAELASRWLEQLRATDILARYGGDEFALALPRSDLGTAMRTVARLQRNTGPHVGFSAGVVEWDGEQDLDDLILRADRVLYEAKAAGAGQVRPG